MHLIFFLEASVLLEMKSPNPVIMHQFANINTRQMVNSIFLLKLKAAYTMNTKYGAAIHLEA